MRDPALLIIEIIRNPRADRRIIEELAEYGMDSDEPLAIVTRADVLSVLQQFGKKELGADDLKSWAIRLLSRRDIEFEFGQEGAVEEALFWLGYQEIAEWANNRLCQQIERMLERRSFERDY